MYSRYTNTFTYRECSDKAQRLYSSFCCLRCLMSLCYTYHIKSLSLSLSLCIYTSIYIHRRYLRTYRSCSQFCVYSTVFSYAAMAPKVENISEIFCMYIIAYCMWYIKLLSHSQSPRMCVLLLYNVLNAENSLHIKHCLRIHAERVRESWSMLFYFISFYFIYIFFLFLLSILLLLILYSEWWDDGGKGVENG